MTAIAISLLLSAVYTATIPMGHFPGRWSVKAGSVAALAWMARRYPLLALALACGSVGDALLDLSPAYFVPGLVAFLCGHIAYTAWFLRSGRKTPAGAYALILYAALFLAWLWPSLGALRFPVLAYVAAITTMAITSFRVGGWVAAGAVLFLVSDSLLAANRFRTPLPLRDWLVWLTYYCGQLAIAYGFCRQALKVSARAPAV